MIMDQGSNEIDFVVTWVDGEDPKWQQKKAKYMTKRTFSSVAQYRDYDLLKYWFRAVECYAPWVRKIHFVTDEQVPNWLKENERLSVVDHKSFIPNEYLPTFNANTIELNLHRIKDISEQFVFFNDDMYLSAPVSKEDFYVKGKPCETAALDITQATVIGDPFTYMLQNDISVLNRHFSKRRVIASNPGKWFSRKYSFRTLLHNLVYGLVFKRFSLLVNYHLPSSMLKSVYNELWETEYDVLNNACITKFREASDVNQYVISWYNICKGNFAPRSVIGKYYTIGDNDIHEIIDGIENGRLKMICINDSPGVSDFNLRMERIQKAFERKFPNKSSFEK